MEKQSSRIRDTRIDTLRALGTMLVILAHVAMPDTLQKIRVFDVVMLVFISGLSFSYKGKGQYGQYLLQRVKKLILPTYVIITALFAVAFLACKVTGRAQLFSLDTIWRSYLFADGIGYIWIVKVYMLIAAASPLVYRMAKETKSDVLFCAFLVGIYGIYHILMNAFGHITVLYQYVFQIFPYVLVACVGMRCKDNKAFQWKALVIACVIAVTDVSVRGTFAFEQHKYPPQYNYLAYGMFVALLFYKVLPERAWKPVLWLSKNSFMVYLFHIVFLLGTNFVAEIKAFSFVGIWYVQFVLVVLLSVAATLVINWMDGRICTKVQKGKEYV